MAQDQPRAVKWLFRPKPLHFDSLFAHQESHFWSRVQEEVTARPLHRLRAWPWHLMLCSIQCIFAVLTNVEKQIWADVNIFSVGSSGETQVLVSKQQDIKNPRQISVKFFTIYSQIEILKLWRPQKKEEIAMIDCMLSASPGAGLLSPFYRWTNWSSERSIHFLIVHIAVSNGAGF